jgi:hypothetical protein
MLLPHTLKVSCSAQTERIPASNSSHGFAPLASVSTKSQLVACRRVIFLLPSCTVIFLPFLFVMGTWNLGGRRNEMVKTTREVVVGVNSVTGDGARAPSSSESECTEYGDFARPMLIVLEESPFLRASRRDSRLSDVAALRQNVVVCSSLTQAMPRDMTSVIST